MSFSPSYFEGAELRLVRNRGQKTLRVSVKHKEVRISVPARASDSEVLLFIEEHQEWIRAMLKKQAGHNKLNEDIQQRMKEEVFLRGKWKRLHFDEHSMRVVETDDELIFPGTPMGNNPGDLALRWQQIICRKELIETTQFWSKKLGIPFNKVTIRNQSSKWGSCSSRGNISLNWRLIKVPLFVRDYIIVHELVHRKHMNHSDAFWNYLIGVYPQTEEAERWLKTYGKTAFIDP